MDQEFWIRAAVKGVKFGSVAKVLASARMQPESKSSTIRSKLDIEHRQALNRFALLPFKNIDRLNRAAFRILLFGFRACGAVLRGVQRGDFRIGSSRRALLYGMDN